MAKPGQEQHTARACTADEFKEVMEYAKQESEKKIEQPIYAFDNAPIHRAAMKKYPDMVPASQYWSVPRYSPDFNKPIEHSWNQVKRKLLNRIYQGYDVVMTPQLAQQWVQEAFFSITQDSVERDVKSLMDTWAIIQAPLGTWVKTSKGHEIQGAGGDYPPSAEYR